MARKYTNKISQENIQEEEASKMITEKEREEKEGKQESGNITIF